MPVNNPHLLASCLQDSCHPQFTSQRITIGADVTGEQETLVGFNQLDKK